MKHKNQKAISSKFFISALFITILGISVLMPMKTLAQYTHKRIKPVFNEKNENLIVVPDENVTIVSRPIGSLKENNSANLVVDPNAVYSNVTTFGGTAGDVFLNGGATNIGGNTITTLVADDLSVPVAQPVPYFLTGFRFVVVNLDAATVTFRPIIRFWRDDGAGGGPGTLITGFTFNPLTVNTFTINTFTANPIPTQTIPTGTIWAGMTFDDNNGGTGATLAQLNNLGHGMFRPIDLGSSVDVFFQTGMAGDFLVNNPAGGFFNFGGAPLADFGWELISNAPTAAGVSVSGRVLSQNGRSISYAIVQMIDQSGNVIRVRTNSFGYFKFENVEVGQSYTFSVLSKNYQFTPQVINVGEQLDNLTFTAQ